MRQSTCVCLVSAVLAGFLIHHAFMEATGSAQERATAPVAKWEYKILEAPRLSSPLSRLLGERTKDEKALLSEETLKKEKAAAERREKSMKEAEKRKKEFEELLKGLGEEGWELAGVMNDVRDVGGRTMTNAFLIFKRPKR